jgi:hypothetical protein
VLLNAVLLKLADVFQSSNNLSRYCIVQLLQKCAPYLQQVLSHSKKGCSGPPLLPHCVARQEQGVEAEACEGVGRYKTRRSFCAVPRWCCPASMWWRVHSPSVCWAPAPPYAPTGASLAFALTLGCRGTVQLCCPTGMAGNGVSVGCYRRGPLFCP